MQGVMKVLQNKMLNTLCTEFINQNTCKNKSLYYSSYKYISDYIKELDLTAPALESLSGPVHSL